MSRILTYSKRKLNGGTFASSGFSAEKLKVDTKQTQTLARKRTHSQAPNICSVTMHYATEILFFFFFFFASNLSFSGHKLVGSLFINEEQEEKKREKKRLSRDVLYTLPQILALLMTSQTLLPDTIWQR